MIKMIKDGQVKLVNNAETQKILEADGWVVEDTKSAKKKAK